MNKVKNIDCPHCKKNFNYYSSEFRPFCCEKCKMVDLGVWFNEGYAIASKMSDESDITTELPEEDLFEFQ